MDFYAPARTSSVVYNAKRIDGPKQVIMMADIDTFSSGEW